MQRLIYILIYPVLRLLSMLPMPVLYRLSDFLFVVMYYILGYRRKVIAANLKLVFPEKSGQERKKISRKFYRHLSDVLVESLKSFSISEKEIKKRFQFQNVEILEDYYKKDRSILLMAGHYCNWEWTGILNRLMPHQGLAVYKPLRNRQFDKLVRTTREHFGARIISNRRIVPALFRYHKKNVKTLTYILSDQTPKLGHYKYRDTFMGIEVPMFTGTEELAKKLDFSVLYLQVTKEKRGFYKAVFVPVADDPASFPDFQITRKFFDLLEAQIHQNPEFYLWSHKRWKHRTRSEKENRV